MKYLKVFTDFALDLKTLNDTECGRLFRAMLKYAEDGTENELPGREAVLWGTAKKNIDNQKAEYEKRCKTNKAIATNRYESLRNATKNYESCQEKDKEKEKYKKEVISNDITKKKSFVPPTLEEVKAYCRARKSTVDAERFYEYFSTGGWKDSKGQPVKAWKQKLITWESYKQTPSIPDKPRKKTSYDIEELERMGMGGVY